MGVDGRTVRGVRPESVSWHAVDSRHNTRTARTVMYHRLVVSFLLA